MTSNPYLIPDTGDEDGNVTDAADDHEEYIGCKKAIVANSGDSEKNDLDPF